jgi:quercetin dioxygenase-like cupin family protein
MSGEVKSDVQLGPIGDKVIFENESIRVWIFSVEPGGIKRMHRHGLPYLIVPLTGGKVEITTLEGNARYAEDRRGDVIWQEAGETHQLRNLNAHQYENVLVELKKHASAPAQGA